MKWFLIFLLLAISIHALTNGFSVDGDGDEYLSYTQALAHHQSVFLQRDDLKSPMLIQKFDELQTDPDPSANWKHLHLVRTRFGQVLTLHFFFYSFICWPVFSLLELLKLPVEATFSVVNLILILILVGYLNFSGTSWGLPESFRQLGSCALLLGGFNYYVWWSGPEVLMIFCMVLSALNFLSKNFALTILFIALASLQNTAVLPFLLVPTIIFFWQQAWGFFRVSPKEMAILFLSALIIAFPLVFNWYELGVLSPIAKVGSYRIQYFNLERVWSFYFDLNQGAILILAPLILVFFQIPKVLLKHPQLRLYGLWILSSVASVVMVAGIYNWNSGGSLPMRYVSWIEAPTVLFLAGVRSKASRAWIPKMAFAAAFVWALSFGFFGHSDSSIQQNWLSELVLDLVPSWYNPVPEIFCSRVQKKEPCDENLPSIYVKGAVKKKALVAAGQQICPTGQVARFQSQSKHRQHIYLNGPIDCVNHSTQ